MKYFSIFLLIMIAVLSIFGVFVNYQMEEEFSRIPQIPTVREFAIVLGASVHGTELSEALRGRMNAAIDLYNQGLVKNILLSGDGTNAYYNETTAMKKFALRQNIPQDNVLTDEKGYSTYATIVRAHDIFHARSAYIITQNFHLVRAVWIAKARGIDAQGVNAGQLSGPWYYLCREFFARIKDYIFVKLNVASSEV